MVHEGYLSVVRVEQRCRGLVWWPGIDRDIETMMKDCTACLTCGKTGPIPPPPLQPLAWPAAPWSHIQVDICEAFPTTTDSSLWPRIFTLNGLKCVLWGL